MYTVQLMNSLKIAFSRALGLLLGKQSNVQELTSELFSEEIRDLSCLGNIGNLTSTLCAALCKSLSNFAPGIVFLPISPRLISWFLPLLCDSHASSHPPSPRTAFPTRFSFWHTGQVNHLGFSEVREEGGQSYLQSRWGSFGWDGALWEPQVSLRCFGLLQQTGNNWSKAASHTTDFVHGVGEGEVPQVSPAAVVHWKEIRDKVSEQECDK